MIFTSKINSEVEGVLKVLLFIDDRPIRCQRVYELWQADQGFRDFFISILRNAPFEALRWETPPVRLNTLDQPFEFVLLDSPFLAQIADPRAFESHFEKQEGEVVVFPNLGRDAVLVVPTLKGPLQAYAHLASFVRKGPEEHVHALWQTVGAAMLQHVGPSPVWLNTAGGGVPWLHVRLDSRPKYYRYGSYRKVGS